MTLGTLKNEPGRWQFQIVCNSHSPHRLGWNPYFAFWIVKFKKYLGGGGEVKKSDYKGFIFSLRAPIFAGNIAIKRFRLLDWLKWDVKPLPKWIPKWFFVKTVRYEKKNDDFEVETRQRQEPRKWLVAILIHQFFIKYPTSIKFI